jgi:Cyclic nucleotide-binding domain
MAAVDGMGLSWLVPNLIHIGALFYLVCFLFRDQLWLRIFAVLGDLVYTGFYFTAADVPLWSAIVYSMLNMTINMVMIALIVQDRRMLPLDDNDLRLYQSFNGMSPGDFRRLRKIGKWQTAEGDQILAMEGQSLSELFYVVDGALHMTKGKRQIKVEPGLFIGEIAYLKNTPASATVVAKSGTSYIRWQHRDLKDISVRHDSLNQSLSNLLSADLAMKVAKSA